MAPADGSEQAVAPEVAGSPRNQAGPGSPPGARAGKAAAPVAAGGPERQARTPGRRGVGCRPWAPWVAHIPGTGRSGCCPGASSRCSIAGRASSAGAAAPAEGTVAGIEEGPRAERADKAAAPTAMEALEAPVAVAAVNMAADRVAGIAAGARRREGPAAAPAGPWAWGRPAGPAAERTAGPGVPERPAETVAPKAPPAGKGPSQALAERVLAATGRWSERGQRCHRRSGPWASRIPCRTCRWAMDDFRNWGRASGDYGRMMINRLRLPRPDVRPRSCTARSPPPRPLPGAR